MMTLNTDTRKSTGQRTQTKNIVPPIRKSKATQNRARKEGYKARKALPLNTPKNTLPQNPFESTADSRYAAWTIGYTDAVIELIENKPPKT